MDEHFVHSRPVVVTEDKIKEALAKQANQRALKAALDQQVLEAERLKAEAHRAKGKRERKVATKSSGEATSPSNLTEAKSGPSSSPPPPPPASAPTNAGPSSSIEPTRFTFSFKGGQATFEETDRTIKPLRETLLPSSAEGRARAGSGDGGGSSVPFPGSSAEKRRNAPAVVPARRNPSSRDSARDGNGPSKRKVSPSAAGGGEYQTNSLPANFKVGKDAGRATGSRERGSSGDSRPGRAASREGGAGRRTAASGDANASSSSGGYDTQSLPVELIYKLSQANATPSVAAPAANANSPPPLSRLKPPQPPRLSSPKRSPSVSRISDSMGMRSPISTPAGPTGSPGSAVRDRSVPASPRGGRAGGRTTTPQDGAAGVRPSARPAGGILPPLSTRRESDTIEMSAMLDARTPPRDSASAAGNVGRSSPRRRTSSTPQDRSPLPAGATPPNELSAAEQARRQAEREKGWAQQVKQLKSELRKARQRAAGKVTGASKADEAVAKAPRRAETAPDPPAHPPGGRAPRGPGGARQRRAEADSSSNNSNNNNNGGIARPTRLEKMDFSKAHIFSRETFRPITAPEDATSYFAGLLGSPPPPRTPLPLVQPKPTPPPAPNLAAERVPKEPAKRSAFSPAASDNAAIQTGTQNSATSGDESLKLASLTTRQVTLGLPDYGDGEPVPIQFLHLHQFVEAQIITATQAENLWEFFALSVPSALGGSERDNGGGGALLRAEGGSRKPSHAEADRYAVRGHHHHHQAGEEEDEMPSRSIEVEEMPHGWSRPHSLDKEEEESAGDFFTPHSPAHPPTTAVLAPALRRKISQLHSEEAALLLQHQKQFHNGRQRPGVTPAAAPKNAINGGGAERKPPSAAKAPLSRSNRDDSDDLEGEGTFDTFSELKLSRRLAAEAGEDDEL